MWRPGPGSLGEFPAHAKALEEDMADILVIAKKRFPNLRVAYAFQPHLCRLERGRQRQPGAVRLRMRLRRALADSEPDRRRPAAQLRLGPRRGKRAAFDLGAISCGPAATRRGNSMGWSGASAT